MASQYATSYLVDLVLDADQSLDFLFYLVLEACISLYSVLDKRGALMFLPCSIKNAVAHVIFWHRRLTSQNFRASFLGQNHYPKILLRLFFRNNLTELKIILKD